MTRTQPIVLIRAAHPALLLVLLCSVPTVVAQVDRFATAATDRANLLDGVREIAAPGIPGPLLVFGPEAFPVVTARVGKELHAPVIAAGRFGSGRIVAFGHTGYGDADGARVGDTARLIQNAVRWAAQSSSDPTSIPRIITRGDQWHRTLQAAGFNAAASDAADLSARLKDADLLCIDQSALSGDELRVIARFVEDGGGLIAVGLGWGWLQLNPGKTLAEHPGNRLLASAGICWADGYLEKTNPAGYLAGAEPSPACHAFTAVEIIEERAGESNADVPSTLLAQASWTTTLAVRTLPANDTLLRPRLRRLLDSAGEPLVPTEKSPFKAADAMRRLQLTLQVESLASVPPEQVAAHPAAAEFPGNVPPDASGMARELTIDARTPDWHSTGLYAAPGRVIEIEVADEALSAKLDIRIGAHTDELWDKDKWSRVPEITRTWPLVAQTTKIASAFGGPIYVVVPRGCRVPKIAVTIRGAVEAPHFIRGRTSLDEWRRTIRARPAPWAELETSKIILTIPSRVIRDLDDPEPLLKFWDDLSDSHATLATISLERARPERFVADVQISAGYMHSGYPIMTHLDVAELFVDLNRLRGGAAWGFFHELGHNHQSGDWTFDGTGEVTCNLFSLYAMDTLCTLPPGERGHEAVNKPPSIAKYIADGTRFEKWKSDPFLALQMYVQLEKAFGWETYKRVFAEYRDLDKDQRPKNDNEKRDQWMTRFSRAVGKNLGPFFQAWGVPTSEAARASIADLPGWMPEGFPP